MTLPPRSVVFRLLNLIMRFAPLRRKWWAHSVVMGEKCADAKAISIPDGYRWKWAETEEIAAMNSHPEADQPGAYARRATRGDRCVCLLRGDELIGYVWFAFESARGNCKDLPPWEIQFLPLSASRVYRYDLYIYKRHRGQSLGSLLRALSSECVKALGYKEVISLIDVHNEASFRTAARTGGAPIQLAYCYQVGNWRRCWFGRKSQPALMEWWEGFKRNRQPGSKPAHRSSGY